MRNHRLPNHCDQGERDWGSGIRHESARSRDEVASADARSGHPEEIENEHHNHSRRQRKSRAHYPPGVASQVAEHRARRRGLNFWDIDRPPHPPAALHGRQAARPPPPAPAELGELAGGRLGELADTGERHEPVLHRRDRYGRDEEWIEFHPAYREMENIAFGRFGMHAMTNRAGVLGWPEKMPPIAKYVFHYLFSQAEFGLLCPVNLTDSSSHLVDLFGTHELRERFLPGMWSQDMGELLKCAQFMTEKAGGSDIGRSDLTAVREGDHWRLWGEKWFCSNVDAEAAVLLARPEGGAAGTRGLGLFLMPKALEDGTRNGYRIMRLKDKLGTKSMASGEIMFEGAVAYQLGELDQGLKQMLVMVNSSRISHLTRAAGMMRRCLNEAMAAARHRDAFGKRVVEHPLMRRQLMKLMVPTEQSLSALLYTAAVSAHRRKPRSCSGS